MAHRETRSLPVRLTEREKANYQTQLARFIVERDELEAAKKAYNDEIQGKIKEGNAKISSVAKIVERGEEHRSVQCEGSNVSGLWLVRRLDTGEIVEERAPRTSAETQLDLPQPEADT